MNTTQRMRRVVYCGQSTEILYYVLLLELVTRKSVVITSSNTEYYLFWKCHYPTYRIFPCDWSVWLFLS